MLPSYRNQSIDLHSKSIDWFLYEGNTGTQWVKRRQRFCFFLRRYQIENVRKFQVGQLSAPKQRPVNNKTVLTVNEHYGIIIVPETHDRQIPRNNEQEMTRQMIKVKF